MRKFLGNYVMRHTASTIKVNKYVFEDGHCEYMTDCGYDAHPLSEDLSSFLLREIDMVIDLV